MLIYLEVFKINFEVIKEKKTFLNALKYPVQDYPKENNG